jgi:hypothetical protein
MGRRERRFGRRFCPTCGTLGATPPLSGPQKWARCCARTTLLSASSAYKFEPWYTAAIAADNAHYGIGRRDYVTNVSKARELTSGDLALISCGYKGFP